MDYPGANRRYKVGDEWTVRKEFYANGPSLFVWVAERNDGTEREEFPRRKDALRYARAKSGMATGDCYETAFKLVVFNDEAGDDWLLCHGYPTGQGPIAGVVHGHAWVEVPQPQEVPEFAAEFWSPEQMEQMRAIMANQALVIDKSNGKDLETSRSLYYGLGNIDPDRVKRYTKDEARAMAVRFGHYGSWDDDGVADS